ncbi:hypothetical protein BDR03DRAFT_534763 [Suillus americanus]|nr:hypothetical protein BDR03DRAFT_534763 [Suillus americanus]
MRYASFTIHMIIKISALQIPVWRTAINNTHLVSTSLKSDWMASHPDHYSNFNSAHDSDYMTDGSRTANAGN